MNYNFEWDPAKAASNLQKHGISFGRVAQIFQDQSMLSIYDEEHSANEERWITMGIDRNAVLLVAVHTFEITNAGNITIRIISARKATKREEQVYKEG